MDDLAAAREVRRLEQHLVDLLRERHAFVVALIENTEERERTERSLAELRG